MTSNNQIRMGSNAPVWHRAVYRTFANTSFRRRCTTADGTCDVYVSPGAQASVLKWGGAPVDAVHTRFIARWVEASSIVWDVGGNMGLFAFPAAMKARAGRVFTFEPDVELASGIQRSLRRPRSSVLPLTLVPCALSDQNGVAEFLVAKYGRSMNKLKGVGDWHSDFFEASETRTVTTLTMDQVAETLAKPTIVKIDVEGAEMKVLAGGRKTIAAQRPVMLIEGPKELQAEMKAFFEPLSYQFLDGAIDGMPKVD